MSHLYKKQKSIQFIGDEMICSEEFTKYPYVHFLEQQFRDPFQNILILLM